MSAPPPPPPPPPRAARAPVAIEAGPVVLRHLDADGAPMLVDAINENLDHLEPWMEWARARATLASSAMYLALQHERFLAGEDLTWSIFEGTRLVGGCGLHVRAGDDPAQARELGYWVAAAVEGRGYATAAGRALVRLAFDVLGLEAVRLRCDEANARSQAVARRLGFRHVETIGPTQLWTLER